MKTKVFWALVALNAILLAGFLAQMMQDNTAIAQQQNQPLQRPGDYMLIPGQILGQGAGIIYIVDVSNRQLGAMAYDEGRRELNVMTPLELDPVFREAMLEFPVDRGRRR